VYHNLSIRRNTFTQNYKTSIGSVLKTLVLDNILDAIFNTILYLSYQLHSETGYILKVIYNPRLTCTNSLSSIFASLSHPIIFYSNGHHNGKYQLTKLYSRLNILPYLFSLYFLQLNLILNV